MESVPAAGKASQLGTTDCSAPDRTLPAPRAGDSAGAAPPGQGPRRRRVSGAQWGPRRGVPGSSLAGSPGRKTAPGAPSNFPARRERPLTRGRSHDCPAQLTPSVHGSRSVSPRSPESERETKVPAAATFCPGSLSASQRTDAGSRDPPAHPSAGCKRQWDVHERRSAALRDGRQARAREELPAASRTRAPPQLLRKSALRAPPGSRGM